MALGALIGAYGEDEAGGLYALQPLAGRTLVEYQVRCAAAAGCAPVVVLVETVPPALALALDRLRGEGFAVVAVSDPRDAAARFEPQARLLQIADGVAPTMPLVERIANLDERAVLSVPDDERHGDFERIDSDHRWAGLALVDGQTLATTAAMLGDWDLLSTLLRRTIQAGALNVPAGEGMTPYHVRSGGGAQAFDRTLLLASRGARPDWVARLLLPPLEEFSTAQLMRSPVRPSWLMGGALALTVAAVAAMLTGYHWVGLALLLLTMPLDLIADRLAQLRLQPLAAKQWARRLLWPVAGMALLALGWSVMRDDGTWGALVLAATGIAFGQAQRTERQGRMLRSSLWLFERRPAILLAVVPALFGSWVGVLMLLALYAAGSFFVAQRDVHAPLRD